MSDHCAQCNGYDPTGRHPPDCYRQKQARLDRRAIRREKRARFGEPVGPLGKKTSTPERVVNFERSDREDIPLGSGDCPECEATIPLGSDHMRGWRGPLCGCGWRGKRTDYTKETEGIPK